jgi:putative transcriptional regulator
MGVSKSYYYKVESGLREPSYDFIKRFKKVFKEEDIDNMFFTI